MSYRVLDLVQGSQEWLQARFDFVTASQVPVLLGLSPYQSPVELFEEKLLRRINPPEGEKAWLFERGHEVERLARDWTNKELKREFKPMVLVSEKLPELMASLDGFCVESNEILEVKYVGVEKLKAIALGDVPNHHGAQVQAQLLVSGAKRCIYFASDGTKSVRQEILPDPSEFESIADEVKRFSKRLREGNPPDLTDEDYLIVQDQEFEEIKKVKEEIARLDSRFEDLKTLLMNRYKENKRVKCNGVSLVRTLRKGNINYKGIEVLKEIDLEKYRGKPSEVVTIKVEGSKK
jgi:putative phage-type endonuclease